jgi:acetolactate synthase-1/3 small subunit
MVEISGQERKIEAFIEAVRPYGIRELARTGRIALVRGSSSLTDEATEEPAAEAVPGAGSASIVGHSNL